MIPSKINLGCGNVIKVEQVARGLIQSTVGKDTEACWLCESPTNSFVGIILIDKTLSQTGKEEALYHELGHAIVDIFQWAVDKRRGK